VPDPDVVCLDAWQILESLGQSPAYQQYLKDMILKKREEHREANEAALRLVRTFVPPDIWCAPLRTHHATQLHITSSAHDMALITSLNTHAGSAARGSSSSPRRSASVCSRWKPSGSCGPPPNRSCAWGGSPRGTSSAGVCVYV
jgi:hypothetical protein